MPTTQKTSTKTKPAKPVASLAILDKRAKRVRDYQDEIIDPLSEDYETRIDAIEGQISGVRAVRDGNPVFGLDPSTGREIVIALRGGLREDKNRLKIEKAEMERGAIAPSEAAFERNAKALEKIERQIAAADKQEAALVATKVTLEDDAKRIRRALRRYGGMKCIRRAPDDVRPSTETLASLIKQRAQAIEEKTATEEGDKSEAEGSQVIDESVDRIGRKARIDLSAALDSDSDIRDIRLLYLNQHDPETNRLVERVPAFELICLLFPDAVKKHCKARLAKHHKENGPVLSADERAAKIKQLRKKISELDWQIVAQVNALHAIGKPASYPPKISVWALMGLQPQKEVRQFRDRIGREEEL